MRGVKISKYVVGPGQPCFIIAEGGVNHNGDVELARRLIDVAAEAGANAVKFQTFRSEKLVSPGAPKASYQVSSSDAAETQLDMVKRLELPYSAFEGLHARCKKLKMLFLSTPFDEESVDFLDGLGVAAFKIGSGEITNWPFLEYVGRKGKPILLSTGMSHLEEVEGAVRLIRDTGNGQIVLLHCVSNYPADPSQSNLKAMQTMIDAFQVPVGYSDHTLGVEVALAAVALGACVIEKHFTLDRNLPGPDHKSSLEPGELRTMISGIRTVEQALGDGEKKPTESEMETRSVARRSLAAAVDIPKGALLESRMIEALRPGTGISPVHTDDVLGCRAARSIKAGDFLAWSDLE